MTLSAGGTFLMQPGPHRLHDGSRDWTETNCYVDIWIELLHRLGLEPAAAGSCALGSDFVGDQWEFVKYPAHDLWDLYRIDVGELNVWRPILDHVEEHLGFGNLLTVEVDSYWLPDTAGTTYHQAHGKTTIVPLLLDRAAGRLDYLHGPGAYSLDGADFDGLFSLPTLAPYVELVRLARRSAAVDGDAAIEAARRHLERRPADNPVTRLGARLVADLPWLSEAGLETFHAWAFGVLRQCGAGAELAADFLAWLPETGYPAAPLLPAVAAFRTVSAEAKSLQFRLARIARGRAVDPVPALDRMATAWATATHATAAALGTV